MERGGQRWANPGVRPSGRAGDWNAGELVNIIRYPSINFQKINDLGLLRFVTIGLTSSFVKRYEIRRKKKGGVGYQLANETSGIPYPRIKSQKTSGLELLRFVTIDVSKSFAKCYEIGGKKKGGVTNYKGGQGQWATVHSSVCHRE